MKTVWIAFICGFFLGGVGVINLLFILPYVSEAFRDKKKWTEMSILNVARMGKFSSDRAIRKYCENIWKTTAISDPKIGAEGSKHS